MSLLNLTNLTRKTVISLPKLVRNFAVPANSKSVKPPLTLHGIEGRYATALYTAATKSNTLSNVENELKQIKTVINKDSKIRALLEDPSLNRNDKKRTVQELLKQGKYCDTTKNLFDLLADTGRLNESSKIIDAYISLMTAHRGEIPVTITSAKELDQKTVTQLKVALSKSKLFDSSHKLLISNKVNPSILGGLMIELGEDKTIDLSVASRIAKLNKLLTDII
ncbi:hypothetical protein Glove_26g140 [Diversispora epigaea]|uniref:ATP synthase subunit 5, mitochondrial n=1 Tax=Diversispora epigaea TaxID=1348612 RepID=A0A397JSE3_9GLOM|nr:hypothetical protein Glove_26g140 [Diversispora epigaea]